MTTKKVLKTAGHIALTLASPPIGLAALTYNCSKKERFFRSFLGFAGGVALSVLATGSYLISTSNRLYDYPRTEISNSTIGTERIALAFFSPLAFPFVCQKVTSVNYEQGKGTWIPGDNVISFNKQTGKYEVNFIEDSPFGFGNGVFFNNPSSVSQARSRLEEALANGDIAGSNNMNQEYRYKMGIYTETRRALDDVVSRMNAELDSQRVGLSKNQK